MYKHTQVKAEGGIPLLRFTLYISEVAVPHHTHAQGEEVIPSPTSFHVSTESSFTSNTNMLSLPQEFHQKFKKYVFIFIYEIINAFRNYILYLYHMDPPK